MCETTTWVPTQKLEVAAMKHARFILTTAIPLLIGLACGGAAIDSTPRDNSEENNDPFGGSPSDDDSTGGQPVGAGNSPGTAAGGTLSTLRPGMDLTPATGGVLSMGGSGGKSTAGGDGYFTGGYGAAVGGSPSGESDGGSGGTTESGEDWPPPILEDCGAFRRAPSTARSAGFSGSDDEYSTLYDTECDTANDCVTTCEGLGGTSWFCEAQICADSSRSYCLPPTKWRQANQALIAGTSISDAAQTSLSTTRGTVQDQLLLQDFDFGIPATSTVLGIQVHVRRAKSSDNTEVRDLAVQLLKNDKPSGSNYGTSYSWSESFETVVYGGPTDLWGQVWSPEEINDAAFGVSISVLPSGPGRAYVDIVNITVFTNATSHCP